MKLWQGNEELECDSGCCSLNSIYDAKRVCDMLEIPHYVVNFKDEFEKYVIDDFINKYKKRKNT